MEEHCCGHGDHSRTIHQSSRCTAKHVDSTACRTSASLVNRKRGVCQGGADLHWKRVVLPVGWRLGPPAPTAPNRSGTAPLSAPKRFSVASNRFRHAIATAPGAPFGLPFLQTQAWGGGMSTLCQCLCTRQLPIRHYMASVSNKAPCVARGTSSGMRLSAGGGGVI